MRKLALGLITSIFLAAPALAADPMTAAPAWDENIPPYDVEFDWSGYYAGVSGGYARGTVTTTGDISGTVTEVPVSGALLGATVGANWQMGHFVLGAEGDLSWSNASGSATCTAAPAYSCNAEIDWLGTVRGRAGFALDKVLVFATGGLAVAQGSGTVDPAFPGLTSEFSDTFMGWTVGGGVEVAVSETMSIKAEYNYLDLGSRTAPAGTLSAESTTIEPDLQTFKVGLNFRF